MACPASEFFGKFQCGMIDLQEVVPDIADEGCTLAFALKLEEDVAGRVARRRIDLDEVVEPVRPAADQVGLAVFEDGHHAFAEGAEFGRALFRIGVDLGKIIDVRLGEHIARVGKGRHPFAVLLPRVPADVVVVQMRAHHHVDLLGPRAGGGKALEKGLVEHVPERAAGLVLLVAAAGVDEDFLAADLQQPAMHGQPHGARFRRHSDGAPAKAGAFSVRHR